MGQMDPALADRTKRSILGITDGDQPLRAIAIPGIEGSIPAKILSTNLRGASTRLIRAGAGWGSGIAGLFTADVEVFVLEGDLQVGSDIVTDYEYAAVSARGVIGRFRTERGVVALLMTSGPVQYDTSSGGPTAKSVVGRPADSAWARTYDDVGLFTRPLATGPNGDIWIGSSHLAPGSDFWHRHPHDEESFVLEGAISYSDWIDDTRVDTRCQGGGYFFRPAGTIHSGPRVEGEKSVLVFHRSFGSRVSERVEPVGDTPVR